MKNSFFESEKNQGSKPQFKTHTNEVSCKLCNSETVHICPEDDNNKRWTRRGGWPRFVGLCGGAPAGRSSNVSTGSCFTLIVSSNVLCYSFNFVLTPR